MNRYRTVFEVFGTGVFPLDMLRYDDAFPTEVDGPRNIGNTINGPNAPEPIRLATDRFSGPTIARWESFGWSCVEVDRFIIATY